MKQRPKVAKQRVIAGCIALVTLCAAFAPAPPVLTVVLDAGHGGKDPNLGTGRYSTTEKDITLDVTLRIGQYIEENLPEVEVIYTRKDDSFPGLATACALRTKPKPTCLCPSIATRSTTPAPEGWHLRDGHAQERKKAFAWPCARTHPCSSEEGYERNYDGFDPNDPDTYIALSLRQNVNLDASLTLGAAIQSQFQGAGRPKRPRREASRILRHFLHHHAERLGGTRFSDQPRRGRLSALRKRQGLHGVGHLPGFRDTYLAATLRP